MRKILYSPGYGAGWSTWGGNTTAQKKFMLEYKPFIEALEREGDDVYAADLLENAVHAIVESRVITWPGTPRDEIENLMNREYALVGSPRKLLALLPQFIRDWHAEFGASTELPYFGGLRTLAIYECDDNALVKIDEYDGHETVVVKGEETGWL